MTRIALLPSAYLPTLGGVQELTRHLALGLVDAGDEVEIWAPQGGRSAHPVVETIDGLTVRRFSYPLPSARIRDLPPFLDGGLRSMHAMRNAVCEFEPDVLHVQCFGPNGAYAAALSRVSRVPLVITLQGETIMDDHDIYEHSTIMRTALRAAMRRAFAVTACSRFTLDDAEARFGLPLGRGQVIFNGVDLSGAVMQHHRAASLNGALSWDRHVLALGRVVEKKGFDLLLRGFAPIATKHRDVCLAIGGDGAALPVLQGLAAELGIADQVRFLGRLTRDEVASVMSAADLFVMPSRVEPFGIVILEAWRAGRAVLATSHGGPPEFVENGSTGVLADPFDTSAMSAALDQLLADAAYRARLGDVGRQRVADFAWPEITRQYRNCYAGLPKDGMDRQRRRAR